MQASCLSCFCSRSHRFQNLTFEINLETMPMIVLEDLARCNNRQQGSHNKVGLVLFLMAALVTAQTQSHLALATRGLLGACRSCWSAASDGDGQDELCSKRQKQFAALLPEPVHPTCREHVSRPATPPVFQYRTGLWLLGTGNTPAGFRVTVKFAWPGLSDSAMPWMCTKPICEDWTATIDAKL